MEKSDLHMKFQFRIDDTQKIRQKKFLKMGPRQIYLSELNS